MVINYTVGNYNTQHTNTHKNTQKHTLTKDREGKKNSQHLLPASAELQ